MLNYKKKSHIFETLTKGDGDGDVPALCSCIFHQHQHNHAKASQAERRRGEPGDEGGQKHSDRKTEK